MVMPTHRSSLNPTTFAIASYNFLNISNLFCMQFGMKPLTISVLNSDGTISDWAIFNQTTGNLEGIAPLSDTTYTFRLRAKPHLYNIYYDLVLTIYK